MARFLLPLLLFALLLAPLRMLGMSEAAAMPHDGHHASAHAAAGHHVPARPSGEADMAMADCMTACAAIAAAEGFAPAPLTTAALLYSASPLAGSGLAPEAEPPPPRLRAI